MTSMAYPQPLSAETTQGDEEERDSTDEGSMDCERVEKSPSIVRDLAHGRPERP
jgi:hypothetical protein